MGTLRPAPAAEGSVPLLAGPAPAQGSGVQQAAAAPAEAPQRTGHTPRTSLRSVEFWLMWVVMTTVPPPPPPPP
eukprot:COSAG04_NODE_30479_length_262_cov_0.944785_1_plen_73_part_10